MTKYEYEYILSDGLTGLPYHSRLLTDRGKEGWQVIFMHHEPLENYCGNTHTMLMRVKPEPPK